MKRIAALFAIPSFLVSPAVAETYTTGSIEVSNPWMRATPRGADVAGAYTHFVTDFLPSAMATRAASLRVVLIGVLLIAVLMYRPTGLFGEERHVSRLIARSPTGGSHARSG